MPHPRNRRIVRAVLALAGLAALPLPLAAAERETPACCWAFLNKGPAREKLSELTKEQIGALQDKQLANFGNLGRQGRAYTAGPLSDNGFIRGIVILRIPTRDQVKECFKDDPFVHNDILAVEAYRWLADTSKFGQTVEPFQPAKHTLGIVKKGRAYKVPSSPSTADSMLKLLPTLRPMEKSGELSIAGTLLDAGDKLGVLLFFTGDPTAIHAVLMQDPAIKDGKAVVELHPLYLGAGVLAKPMQTRSPDSTP